METKDGQAAIQGRTFGAGDWIRVRNKEDIL